MIATVVTFRLPERWTVERAAEVYRSTAPKYLHTPGLVRKHYVLHDGGERSGGIYLWRSRADAEACFDAAWRAAVTEKYGTPPEVVFMTSPVTVDPVANAIEDDGR
jgi:hypothetical protein